jgi:hypothetical protein
MQPLTSHEIRHAAQFRPGSVAVGAVVVGRVQLRKELMMTLDEIRQRVDAYMRSRYRIGLDEIEITDVPGYWQDREPRLHPGHPLHGTAGNQGAFRATYTYYDSHRMNGRYASNTRSWRAIWEAEKGTNDGIL